jgi:hypothetical protein
MRRACLLLLGIAACGRTPAGPAVAPRAASDAVVARVAGAPIYASDVAGEMRRSGTATRAALDAVIDRELLAAAAARAIDGGDPDLRDTRRRAMVEAMLERELEPRIGRGDIPDSELRAVYDRARSFFVHPRLVEVGLLTVYTGARMKDEPRARALATAQALAAEVARRPARTPEDLKALAEDSAWKDRRVKYARVWQAYDDPLPAEVGRAVAQLERPGDTTPLVTSEVGYHVARYISERPPESVTFEQARDSLRDKIFDRWRQARFLSYVQSLAGPHDIQAYPERL